MPRTVSSCATEQTLRKLLRKEGYSLSRKRGHGETGVDIIAEKRSESIFIEVIAHKARGSARSKDFYQAFFRAVSRIREGARRCVIALPNLAQEGLPDRARQYGEAWRRIGDSFPELEIWLVDAKPPSYTISHWNKWLG